MSSVEGQLRLVKGRGWRSGLGNLLRRENGLWWRTSRWWVQSLLWFIILNGTLVFSLWVMPLMGTRSAAGTDASTRWQVSVNAEATAAEGLGTVLVMMGIFPAFGVLIVAQGAIIGEKQSGTAAWILSGPVSRAAFILAKLIANAVGLLVTMIVLQGMLAYAQLSLSIGGFLPPIPILVALSLHALHLLFYLTLTLMLGTLFSSRGPVLAIPIAVLIGQGVLESVAGELAPWFPWHALPGKLTQLATVAAGGHPLPTFGPIMTALVASAVFVLLAVWRFRREEF